MCNRNFCDYNSYYSNQIGGKLDISYYRGLPYQRGHGRFATIARRYGIPVLKFLMNQGKEIGKETFSTLKTGLKRAARKAAQDFGDIFTQEGSGLRKKPRISPIKRRKIKRVRKTSQKKHKKLMKKKKK